ncbi:MAG: helix-turn-helix domain-containing protein [Galactobacter sp.]
MADKKKMELGPTGERVRANLTRLRGSMQYKVLAEKLNAAGRPIPTIGLRRIEAGERRVDVDDLTAFAAVFGVSPLTLLMPDNESDTLKSGVTGLPDEYPNADLWSWAHMGMALPVPDAESFEERERLHDEYTNRSAPRGAGPTSRIKDRLKNGPDDWSNVRWTDDA